MAHLTVRGRLARRSSLSLLSLALAVGVISGADARSPAEPEPGGSGIGDPYFPLDGNGGIDVKHYDVHDEYVFSSGRLSGRTSLTVRATADLSKFNLDFLLPVRDVRVDGRPATHSRPKRHELQITPADPIASGETFEVVVRYSGRPGPLGYAGEKNWVADADEVVAVNEPHMAPWWFPSNDHPLDKAKFDIQITTGDQKRVVSNGSLVSRTERRGRATTHWRSTEPMTTYLAFFTAGYFDVAQGKRDGLPWYAAVSRALPRGEREAAMTSLRRSPAVTDWLAGELGPYPFSSTGGVVTGLPLGFALENQTRPVYPGLGPGSRSLLVHELAHQWFGDSVSVEGWRDIWLNEGFATYMEARDAESRDGRSTQEWLGGHYRARSDDDGFWTLQIDDPGPDRIFDNAVYLRGGMTIAALRERIGGRDVRRVLRTWAADNAGGNVTTADFEALAETTSGEDLDGFFDAWLRGDTPPEQTADNGLGDI